MNAKKIIWGSVLVIAVLYVGNLLWNVMKPKTSENMIEAQASELGATERAWAEKGQVKPSEEDKLEALAMGKGLPQAKPVAETAPTPAPTPTTASAATPQPQEAVKSCSQDDVLFERNGCKTSDLKQVAEVQATTPAPAAPARVSTTQAAPAQPAPPPRTYSQPPASSQMMASNTAPSLSAAASSILAGKGLSAEPTVASGMSKSYPGAAIRTGCYLITEMVEDELIVVSGNDHMLTLDVKGAMPGCKLPPVWPIRLVAYVTLNGPQNRIVGKVKTCTGGANDQRSIDCKARIKDVSGADGLAGEVYDQSGWGIVLDMALAIGTAPTIANLTKEVAGAQNFWAGAASQEIAGTLQKSVQRVSDKINKAFEGREIHLKKYYHNGKPVGPFVMVAFEEDALL